MLSSIRIRLTLWYAGTLSLIILIFSLAIYFFVERNLDQTVNNNLASISKTITENLRREQKDRADEIRMLRLGIEESDGEEIPSLEETIVEEISDLKFIEYQIAVMNPDGKELISKVTDKKVRAAQKTLEPEKIFSDVSGENGFFRVFQKQLRLEEKDFRILIAQPLTGKIEFLSFLKKVLFFAVLIALLLTGIGGYLLASRSFVPVVSMSNQAERIGTGNLSERLPVKNERDELGRLAKVFNSLLSRLENSFKQQQRFIADASHELRTPVSIIRTESEVAVGVEERNVSDYRESLEIVHLESRRLSNIVDDLFLLARSDQGYFSPQIEDVYLDEIISDAIRAVRTLAEKRGIKVNFSKLPEMPLTADRSLLHRLFLNLLDNAIKYNSENGMISINAEEIENFYRITISDTGNGIAADEQSRIFDRFYRSDRQKRNGERVSGGAGLGLPISLWIAQVHRGSLDLERSDSNGSVFCLELPR